MHFVVITTCLIGSGEPHVTSDITIEENIKSYELMPEFSILSGVVKYVIIV